MLNDREICRYLEDSGIDYERYEHAAVHTCEEAERAVPPLAAVHTKNLFLRDRKGRRHFLLVTTCDTTVDLKAVSDRVAAGRLSFASPERLARHLGVEPGSVTLLGLANDAAGAVELLIDREVWEADSLRAHPLVNTATLVLSREAARRFLERTGHEPRIVDLDAPEPQR